MFARGVLDCCARRPACLSASRPALLAAPGAEHAHSVVCGAKKKKGKKKGGGGQKKPGGVLATMPKAATAKPWLSTDVIMRHFLMVECYSRAAGKPLLEGSEITNMAQAIYDAPFAILAHNRFALNVPDDEAVFTFANAAALKVFDAEWSDLVGTPSLRSVEGMPEEDAAAREDVLSALAARAGETGDAAEEVAAGEGEDEEAGGHAVQGTGGGVVSISGWRRKVGGGRVRLEDAALWNIRSPTGAVLGQAVWFDTITTEDGRTINISEPEPAEPASEEEIAAAEAAVAAQGDEVRALKDSGKDNTDPDVAAAVAVLLERKAVVTAMKDGSWQRPEGAAGAAAGEAPAAGEAAADAIESAPAA